jgi:hypothetical protein
MTDWVVIGIYCDGTGRDGAATRHDPVPVMNYRRLVDTAGERTWAPLYSSNDVQTPLDNKRAWLDGDTVSDAGQRATDTFNCPRCGFNLPRRWEDIERILDIAYDLPRPRIMLREWAGWIR